MIISEPTISQKGEKVFYRTQVTATSGKRDLWYSVDKKYGDMLSDSADAALLALLFPAMVRGENIEIKASISERLYYNLSKSAQVVLQSIFPKLHKINIKPRELSDSHQQSQGVATGFSGGIDSFCVLADHYYSDSVPDGFRLTHLLFNNVGSHGAGGESLFNKRFSRLQSLAEKIGLPILAINSNMDSFYYDLGYAFVDTHTPRNVSVAHLLKGGIGRYYYASTHDYTAIGTSGGKMPQCEPFLLPLFSTKTMDVIASGSEYTRVEKTLKVAEIEDSYDLLDICIKAKQAEKVDAVNCSTCSKCMRTLLTLEIAGLLDRYDRMFDLELYRSQRYKFIATILENEDPLSLTDDILSFVEQRNFQLPLSSRFYGYTGLHKLFPYYERALNLGKRISREGMGYLFKRLRFKYLKNKK